MAGTLILATHGIEGGPGAAAEHACAIRARGGWAEVRVGCLRAEPSLAEALAGAPPPVVVVPLLMAEGYIHGILRRRLAEAAPGGEWQLAEPVGASSGLAALVLRKAEASRQSRGWPRSETALLLVGHGTPRHAASAAHARTIADALADSGFAAAGAASLEQQPLPAAAAMALPAERVVAVGLFLDNGPHGDTDLRAALAQATKPVAYAGAVGADPAMVALILEQARGQ